MPVPESFQTARLDAEKLASRHLPNLQALHRDPDTMAELGEVRSDSDTSRYLARNLDHWAAHGFGVWMLRLKKTEPVIGRVVLRWLSTESINDVEIGFALLPDYWGRGLATEAGQYCLSIARSDLDLETLIGVTTPKNQVSQQVLAKLGMRYECETAVEKTRCFVYRVRW